MVVLLDRKQFDIREHLDKLTPAKGKNRYICPVCQEDNMTIDQNTGEYQCWSGCECAYIREAVSPWNEVQGKSYQPKSRKPILKAKPPSPPTPAPIKEGEHDLAKLPNPFTHPSRRQRGNQTEIEYRYSENQWVLRVEKPNPDKPKGYEKDIYPYHLDAEGNPKRGKGDAAWDAYRIDEVLKYGAGKWVIAVEGESCVEAVRYLGLVSFTFQGSGWSDENLKKAALQFKEGGIIGIFCNPDNDPTGYKKAAALSKAAALAQIPFILISPSKIWKECPHNGDIADWVKWTMEQGWSQEQAREHLEKLFRAAVEREQLNREIEQEAWDDSDEDIPDSRSAKAEFTQFTLELLYGDKPWICVDGTLYYWNSTHYKRSPDAVEIRRLADFCNSYALPTENGLIYPYAKPSKVKEALEWVKMRLSIDPELVNPPGINCINGVVGVKWQNFKPIRYIEAHDPTKHYYLYEPLVRYNPQADTTDCERLLCALDKPQQEVLLRNLAAAIDLPTVRKLRGREVRILLACGLGANGKDALRQTVSTIFGHSGMTSVSLADFSLYDEGRKFALAPLVNSRVNWASENPQTARLDKIQSLKLFATGNILHSERKGRDHIEFTPKGIGIFNLNETPSLQGVMQAILDRIAVIKFTKTFKNNPNPNDPNELQADPRFAYDDEFIQTNVAPAFLNKMFDALEALIEEGIDYECTTEAFQSMQKENNHLLQFCEDVRLGYIPGSAVTAMDIWTRLEEWYQGNGTLTIEENGKRIWAEQVKISDKNVKAPNQVIGRFRQLFPKAKLVTVPHPNDGKKQIQALQGIGFHYGDDSPDGNRDNNPGLPTPVWAEPTPIPPQDPLKKTTENQASHPTHPNFSSFDENQENQKSDLSNVAPEIQKSSNTPQQLGWVGCDAQESSVPEVGTGVGVGVENPSIGVEEPVAETPISPKLLVSLICDAVSWAEVETIVAVAPFLRRQVWGLLSDEQKSQIRMMKLAASGELTNRAGGVQGASGAEGADTELHQKELTLSPPASLTSPTPPASLLPQLSELAQAPDLISAIRVAASESFAQTNLVGKRVFVTEGMFRTAGEGVIECDRGWNVVDIRMLDGMLQTGLKTGNYQVLE
jgi:putative DNA primase/helicase